MRQGVKSFTVQQALNGYVVYVYPPRDSDAEAVEYVFPTEAKLKKFINFLLKDEETE